MVLIPLKFHGLDRCRNAIPIVPKQQETFVSSMIIIIILSVRLKQSKFQAHTQISLLLVVVF